MSTVYVVQKQHRFDRNKGELVPKFNLAPAEEYGELSYLLSPTAAPWDADSIIRELYDRLQGFADSDSLLLVGNPVLIGLAVAVAADVNQGFVRCLQWSGKDRRYIAIETDLSTAR